MTVLPNVWAKLFFWLYMTLFLAGIGVFLKNIVQKDWEYEVAYPWSLRGLVYLFSPMFWFIALPVGIWLYQGNPQRRKFALGLFLVSGLGASFMLSEALGMAIM